MPRADDLLDDLVWTGGHYEASIALRPADDAAWTQAVQVLCQAAGVRRADGSAWADDPLLATFVAEQWVHGLVRLPHGVDAVCGVTGWRPTRGDADLTLFVPLEAVSRVDDRVGAFPFDDVESSLDWRAPLDEWLARVVAQVHDAVGIERALIGFETADFAEHDGYAAVVVPRAGVGVDYRPATR